MSIVIWIFITRYGNNSYTYALAGVQQIPMPWLSHGFISHQQCMYTTLERESNMIPG